MYRITVTYHDNHSSTCLVQASSEQEALRSVDPVKLAFHLVTVNVVKVS